MNIPVLTYFFAVISLTCCSSSEAPDCRTEFDRLELKYEYAYKLFFKYGDEFCRKEAKLRFPEQLEKCKRMFKWDYQNAALDCVADLHTEVGSWLPACIPNHDDLGILLPLTLDYEELENVVCQS